MNSKTLVLKKNGHNLWADVNPLTQKLQNFSISGYNANPKHTYTSILEAEAVFNRCIGESRR